MVENLSWNMQIMLSFCALLFSHIQLNIIHILQYGFAAIEKIFDLQSASEALYMGKYVTLVH